MNERRSDVTTSVSRCQWRFPLDRQGVIASDLPIACRFLPFAHGFGTLPAESSIRGRSVVLRCVLVALCASLQAFEVDFWRAFSVWRPFFLVMELWTHLSPLSSSRRSSSVFSKKNLL
jgi:hypothetical protein